MVSEVEAGLHSSVVFHAPVDVPRQVKYLMGNQLLSRNCGRETHQVNLAVQHFIIIADMVWTPEDVLTMVKKYLKIIIITIQ